MTIQRLSRLSDWKLKDREQNLCGRVLRAQNGEVIGTVIDMVVDTELGLVTSVVMQDDSHVLTENVELRDDELWLSELAIQPVSVSREPERFVPGERDERPVRDSETVREEIRLALEEHKRARYEIMPRDLQQDMQKPDSSGEAESDRP
ncbi:hypothetical protein [Bradymonas sediminis]|uniref:Uncharacterized protein n=1 Tax=Bradymonas sediminis TaxID=1548548 RepID=A0A2Z4FJ95_9DELT|nr:hypothetical protein [Bradymonas sediminis]AWV88910.1 hypothetical protein DN745_05980 [Bradymonas sediminis]TDP71917.1 hypothetical protein DFR33_108131 [Bradymonas sediminis]